MTRLVISASMIENQEGITEILLSAASSSDDNGGCGTEYVYCNS